MKIGAGPVPIETSEGWLLLYHGVLRSCNGYVYAVSYTHLDVYKRQGLRRGVADTAQTGCEQHAEIDALPTEIVTPCEIGIREHPGIVRLLMLLQTSRSLWFSMVL